MESVAVLTETVRLKKAMVKFCMELAAARSSHGSGVTNARCISRHLLMTLSSEKSLQPLAASGFGCIRPISFSV